MKRGRLKTPMPTTSSTQKGRGAVGLIVTGPTLTTARSINAAVERNYPGRGGYVYCTYLNQDQTESCARIYRARTRRGQLQVQRLADGRRLNPIRVWVEGEKTS